MSVFRQPSLGGHGLSRSHQTCSFGSRISLILRPNPLDVQARLAIPRPVAR